MTKYEDYNEGRVVTGYTRTKFSVTWILLGRRTNKANQIFTAQKFHKYSPTVYKQQNLNINFKAFVMYSVELIIFSVLITCFSETSLSLNIVIFHETQNRAK